MNSDLRQDLIDKITCVIMDPNYESKDLQVVVFYRDPIIKRQKETGKAPIMSLLREAWNIATRYMLKYEGGKPEIKSL